MEEAIHRRQDWQQLKEKPPDKSIQAVAFRGRPVEKAIQSKECWQQLKEEPPDSQGNKSIQAIASGGRPVEEAILSRKGRQEGTGGRTT